MNCIKISNKVSEEKFSSYISDIIAAADENTEIILEKGKYFLNEPISISDKKKFVFDGGGSTLVPEFHADKYYWESTDAFHITGCNGITLKNFKVSASFPSNTAGRILKSTPKYVEVELDSSVPMTGKELCLGGMSYYENWVSDWIPLHHWGKSNNSDKSRYVTIAGGFRTSAPEKLDAVHKVIEKNRWHIETSQHWELLKPGMKCSIYHAYYGLSAFVFKNTNNALIENVHIANFGGMGFVILPRCSDFIFRKVRIASDDIEHQPYSTCSDGIHTTGIGGKLTLEDCFFELLGDDCLNLHTNAMTVRECSKNKMSVFLDKPNSIMPEYWAQRGDILRIYDSDTLLYKGNVKVTEYFDGSVEYEDEECMIKKGDFVSNSFFFPHFVMKNCIVCHTRSRFVIQSADSCEIYGNTFYATDSCIYLSTAFRYWGEVGPVKNADIYNNRFVSSSGNTVHVRVNDENSDNIRHMHKNISIHDNIFENVSDKAVNIQASDNVTVKNNRFVRCSKNPVIVKNCDGIVISGNCSES